MEDTVEAYTETFHFGDDPDDSGVTTGRLMTIAIIPHFTAALSFFGSLYIVIDILRDKNKLQKTTYHRLMLGMSISDLLASFFLFLSTWPVPKETTGVFAAMGNMQTCAVQGFFIQLGVATFLYTAFLAVYYLLMMRYHWKERDFCTLEKIWHGFAILLTLGTAIAALCMKLYNNANIWCWIAPLPLDCLNSSKNDGESTCERGDNAYIYRIAFYFFWLWTAVIVVAVCMVMVFLTIWRQDRVMQRWNPTNKFSNDKKAGGSRGNKLVQAVAVQSTLYIGAFLLTAIFPSLVRMFQAKWNCTSTFYPLTILTVTFFPLQGFWNFLIYMRPRFATARKEHPEWSFLHAVRYTLGRTLGCSLPSDDKDYKLGLEETEEAPTCIDGNDQEESQCADTDARSSDFDGNQSETEKSQQWKHSEALWVEAVDKQECIEKNDQEETKESQCADTDAQGTE